MWKEGRVLRPQPEKLSISTNKLKMRIIDAINVLVLSIAVDGFTLPHSTTSSTSRTVGSVIPFPSVTKSSPTNTQLFEYVRPEVSEAKSSRKPPFPKIGDLVRFYDLDGGKADGQELVGKLTFIQSSGSSWLGEIAELDDVGEGYYAEYPSRKRRKTRLVQLENVSPLIGSYVRSEDAFKIPTDRMGKVSPYFESYNLEEYEGPRSEPINEVVVQEDLQKYSSLKGRLLRDAAIAGLVGTIIADLAKGFDDALVYFFGAVAGVGYLFFLGIKTDTVGSQEAKMGNNISNLRFLLPLIVLIGVSLQNLSMGAASPVSPQNTGTGNVLRLVSQEQFAAAMLGFLTYRIPLFVSQLGPIIGDTAGVTLPGSAGIAMQMARDAKESSDPKSSPFGEDLTTVLVISGPACTGKPQLVKKLIEESEGKLIAPSYIDKISDPIMFEQLEARNEILQTDSTGRYGLTKDAVLNAATKANEDGTLDQVVVIDANVALTRKLANLAGIRLVGVWVGLDELDKFEGRLTEEIESGKIAIPDGETKESLRRSKIREIVKDIEYGVVSGIFEFTILNDDDDDSLLQLQNAAEYCFK